MPIFAGRQWSIMPEFYKKVNYAIFTNKIPPFCAICTIPENPFAPRAVLDPICDLMLLPAAGDWPGRDSPIGPHMENFFVESICPFRPYAFPELY